VPHGGREQGRRTTSEPANISVIELTVQELAQLFESLDPYPFRDRDLDKDAEEFIVGWARELPGDHALQIVVHLPSAQAQSHTALESVGGMNRFFAHRAEAVSRDLRELFRVGRMSLVVGVSVLIACVVAAQYAETLIGSARPYRAGKPGHHGLGRQLAPARNISLRLVAARAPPQSLPQTCRRQGGAEAIATWGGLKETILCRVSIVGARKLLLLGSTARWRRPKAIPR
jgi:hypothetical protein